MRDLRMTKETTIFGMVALVAASSPELGIEVRGLIAVIGIFLTIWGVVDLEVERDNWRRKAEYRSERIDRLRRQYG